MELLQKKLHVIFGRQWPHHANAKNSAGERTETPGDFNTRPVQKASAHFSFVNAFRHTYCVQRRNLMLCRDVHAETHRFYALDESVMATAMPLPPVLDSFFGNNQKRLPQCVKHRNRRRVMVA